jgi:hypothetical protein
MITNECLVQQDLPVRLNPLRIGLHGFWGTWLRYNSLEWSNHSASLCLALHPKNRTLQSVQLRLPG